MSNIYAKLGVRTVINATGTFTRLSGTLMPPEVVQAMTEAAQSFVCIEELQYQAGKIIAEITGAEAAYVTSGAQAGLVLAIAACIAGLDPVKMDKLPHTDGMANEVIIAKAHRNHYDHGVEAAGGRIVEVGSDDLCRPEDIAAAITDKTVAGVVSALAARRHYVGRGGSGGSSAPHSCGCRWRGALRRAGKYSCFYRPGRRSGGLQRRQIYPRPASFWLCLWAQSADLFDCLAASGYGFYAQRLDCATRTAQPR